MTHYAAPCWYGKVPSAGDFVKRRFPDVLYRQWSSWFQVGLHHWQSSQESDNAPVAPVPQRAGLEFCGAADAGQSADSDGLPDCRA